MMIERIDGRTYLIKEGINAGFFDSSGGIIIDSGMDENAARRIINAITKKGMKAGYVLNTHAHADHAGGNAYLKRHGIKVVMHPLETHLASMPVIEPAIFFGSFPPEFMLTDFLYAKPSSADITTDKFESELEIIESPGHTHGHIVVRTPDLILFLGDTVYGKAMFEQYKIPYFYDVGKTMETLYALKNVKAHYYVPGHGDVIEGQKAFRELVEYNIDRINEILGDLMSIASSWIKRESIAGKLMKMYGIKVRNPAKYYIYFTTISSLIAHLIDKGMLEYRINEHVFEVRAIRNGW